MKILCDYNVPASLECDCGRIIVFNETILENWEDGFILECNECKKIYLMKRGEILAKGVLQ